MSREGRSFRADRYRNQTHTRLILAGFAVLIGIGGGLIWLMYGRLAALSAVTCLLVIAGVYGLLWFFLELLSLWLREDEP